MKKNIYTGIFCTILGLCINTPANASIVSRNYLDEALTDYATTTALDLKANQSDFTELNTQISDSVDMLRLLLGQGSSSEFVNGNIDPEKFPNTISGAFGLLYQYLDMFAGSISWDLADLNNGWTDSESMTYLGVKGLNDKIGTLPSGDFPPFPGYELLFPDLNQPLTYPTSLAELITAIYGNSEKTGLLSAIITGFPLDTDGDGQFDSETGLIPNFALARNAKNLASTNATKIGTLPSGNFPDFPGYDLLPWLNQPLIYPTSLAELITAIYGNSETGKPGLLAGIIAGFPIDTNGDGINDSNASTLSNFWLAKEAIDLANANATKIGDLPSGDIPLFPGYEFYSDLNQPLTYPTSLAELITAIYGNSETGQTGLLEGIIAGFGIDTDGDGQFDSNIGTLSNYGLAKNAIDLANANATKIGTVPDGKNLAGMIGTLPTGYDSVGAALTAIKGIAEDAKAAALAAIPDPKTEGSNGKYVLTVDIVGDNATYRWEPIDRGDTTPTTE